MTLAEHYTFGTGEHVALRMLPCQSPRIAHESRHDFLRVVHPTGYRDLRAFHANTPKTRGTSVADLAAVDAFATTWHDCDVYVGVATRASAQGRALADCLALHALFADLDFKLFPSEATARARLATFPLSPSIVVASGGGLHCYWLLHEPLDLQNGGAPTAKHLLRALATTIGADQSAAEPARILRLPGTRNHKYTPARPVVVELFTEATYTLADLVAVVGPLPDLEPAKPLPDV